MQSFKIKSQVRSPQISICQTFIREGILKTLPDKGFEPFIF